MTDQPQTATILVTGLLMIAVTIVLNVAAVVLWLRVLGGHIRHRSAHNKPPMLFMPILATTLFLLVVHMIEAFVWALLYISLPGKAGLASLHDAFYFSIITLTTLGYGDVTLNQEWQLLSGLESMIGIIVFGMTTALLFAVIQKCWLSTHQGRAAAGAGTR